MAIYIYLQCCKCKNSHKLHLYSFSFNQYEIFNNLCEHFNIKYTYITNFGFFTLGWSITLEVKVQCRKCEESYYNFGKITFNSENYDKELDYVCCNNVFSIGVSGDKFSNNGKALLKQEKINKEIRDKLKMEEEKRNQERRKIEEEKRNQEKIEIERQNYINKIFDYDMNYIDEDLNDILLYQNTQLSIDLTFDINEEIEKKLNYNVVKTS